MATQKRLLYVITKSNFGGAQRYVLELALAMREAGYLVKVAAGGQGELIERLEASGIATYEIMGAQREIDWRSEVSALLSLRTILKDFKPDIVHLNSSKAGLLGSLLARLLRVPTIVFTAHGWPFREARSRSWLMIAWLGSYLTSIFADRVITVCEFDTKSTYLFGTKSKQTVIRNALSPFTLLPRTEARKSLFSNEIIAKHLHDVWLVTHGEVNPNKNHTTAIDAVAEFNSNHPAKVFYTIIGAGELVPSLREQVSLRGMNDFIYFMDHVPEVRTFLLAFDLYIMPSLKEGLPYSLLEAGYAGLPVIASRVGGVPEVIYHQETGLLVNPRTHTGMVEALALLINEPEKRSLYSNNLLEHLRVNFDQAEMMAATKAVYELGDLP